MKYFPSLLLLLFAFSVQAQDIAVRLESTELPQATDGRLFVAFSRDADDEPRFSIGWPVAPATATRVFAMDIQGWDGDLVFLEPTAGYPLDAMNELEEGTWYVQALFDQNRVLPDLNAPLNLYSPVRQVQYEAGESLNIRLNLAQAEPAEALPEDTAYLKHVKIHSPLLSGFYGQDIHLRASVLLPRAYVAGEASGDFPVLYMIGGLNARYDRSVRLFEREDFRDYWADPDGPQVVMVFLDGMSPWGDSYQVNSEVSGPYADANFTELFPYLAENFPIQDQPDSRYLSGCSTGGWVSMALQVFYPDYFAGSWPFSPDSPTFHAFQLVDLYEDRNAFTNEHGMWRPSMRETDGEPMFGVGDEIAAERMMGTGDNWLYSGQQWAVWNVVYGSLDSQGQPVPVWNEQGAIDKQAVEAWRRWDIEQYIQNNWGSIGESLAGKLHFTMGDMDNFYLNVGLRRLEQTLSGLESPDPAASFAWEPGVGHCDFSIQQFYIEPLQEIDARH